ncbi:hypothetical protein BD626DRAFT_593077 [Schizophyllum amplum]|uniref:Uncharacterized protein n=1 Tax=Schizophyllum amplum TaxID=97359 RepID=A0A550CDA5_9AGAR|nr:hypothetical protein BD626DRAFT_593077 [Auriculariopsis ampla]
MSKVDFPLVVSAPQIAQLSPVKGKGKGRKRTLTLVDGSESDASTRIVVMLTRLVDTLDLNASLPVTPQIMEAMRLRIIQLEEQVASAQPPPAKRARVEKDDNYEPPVASTSAVSAKQAAGDAKKRKMQFKTFFDRLKKECKSDNVKFQGKGPKTIKFDEVLTHEDFEALFKGKGNLIQPTPTNKPKSTVTIMTFNSAQITDLFEGELKPLKGNRWTRSLGGGLFGGGMFGGGGMTMSKSKKTGACDLTVNSLEVNYSKNNMKCTLKFDVSEVGGGYGYGGYDSDGW